MFYENPDDILAEAAEAEDNFDELNPGYGKGASSKLSTCISQLFIGLCLVIMRPVVLALV